MSPIEITRKEFCPPDLSALVVVTILVVLPLLIGGIAVSRFVAERKRRTPRPEEMSYWKTVLGVYAALWALEITMCSGMLTRTFAGKRGVGEVTAKRDWTESSKGRLSEFFSVTVRMPSGFVDTFDVAKPEHEAVKVGDQVVVMVAPEPGGEVLEPAPSLHSMPAVFGFVFWIGSSFLLRHKPKKTKSKKKPKSVEDLTDEDFDEEPA